MPCAACSASREVRVASARLRAALEQVGEPRGEPWGDPRADFGTMLRRAFRPEVTPADMTELVGRMKWGLP